MPEQETHINRAIGYFNQLDQICDGQLKPGQWGKPQDHLRQVALRIISQELAPDSNLLNFIGAGRLFDIFDHLRQNYSLAIQERLFASFFGPEGANFPNGEDLGRYLAQVNKIPWFQPTEAPDKNFLQEQADNHLKAHSLKPLPIKLIVDDWQESREALGQAQRVEWFTVARVAELTGRREVMNMAHKLYWCAARPAAVAAALERANDETASAAREMALIAVATASMAGAYIIVQDLMTKEDYVPLQIDLIKSNFMLPKVKILQRGLMPLGQVEDDFVIFVPPLKKAA